MALEEARGPESPKTVSRRGLGARGDDGTGPPRARELQNSVQGPSGRSRASREARRTPDAVAGVWAGQFADVSSRTGCPAAPSINGERSGMVPDGDG